MCFLEQMVAENHNQVHLCFCLPPDYEFLGMLLPLNNINHGFLISCGHLGTEQVILAVHKCIYKMLELVLHKDKFVF